MHRWDGLALVIALLCLTGCGKEGGSGQLFKLLAPDRTGITFANTITTSDSVNLQTDVYIYNGAGVAVGDIDNDGLSDIFFSGNMVSSRLYLNKGEMRFDDVTERAGVTTKSWATGATMVDINGDGQLDIYVSVSGPEWSKSADRANLLFVNNGNKTFTEAAGQYGVADTGFTTHAVFLDYNRDGCLDFFLLNNSPKDFSRGVISEPLARRGQTPGSYNELYRNDCKAGKGGGGKFTNVSQAAGILRDAGYGLGVVVADLNGDAWPDIYVSNDGTPNDVLYVNNGDGTFTNKAGKWLKHTSAAGMGVDIADFNNDGWPDVLQVDMMPPDAVRRKRMSGYVTPASLMDARGRGFRDDYILNSLQLSNGVTRDGDIIFSEISRLAGVSHTDWSWSALFADFDNDGYKDIFISNGYPRAANDLDYQNAISLLRRRSDPASRKAGRDLLNGLPSYHEPNYVFRNAGDLTFTDKSKEWGMDHPSFSYGAAYADLDNDGRLDLVVNNIDAAAFVYQNVAPVDEAHHYLAVRLEGESPQGAVGSTLILTAGGKKQYLYNTPYRGYMSTMDGRAHFGLGSARRVDSVEVEWPDGRYQLLTGLDVDRLLVVKQSDAKEKKRAAAPQARGHLFDSVDPASGLKYLDQSVTRMDYNIQPLLPYTLSSHGPPLAVGDVNGDGQEDVFIGGGAGVPGKLFIQSKGGGFVESVQGQPWEADKAYEDWGAVFFDANGDGLPDLYVSSGAYQVAPTSASLQDRLYVNQGSGRFARDTRALPVMLTSTSTVRAGDFNGDGRPDLFVGGRLTPRKYPYPTRSYLLRNDGGRFTDVTEEWAPQLVNPGGMITDAIWVDFDGDGRVDLVTAGEWMPVEFYRNEGPRFTNVTSKTKLPPVRGWWYSLAAGDFDKDGRTDIVAGNLGLNYSYTTSKQNKFGVYANNFTGNQTTDVVLTESVDGKEYPLAGMAPLGREIYTTAAKFPTYGSFARATMRDLFSAGQLQQSLHYGVDTFASIYWRNDGNGTFTSVPLPNLAQIAPIKAMIARDLDGDGHLDLLVAGNLYDTEPNTPRADAGNGLWLKGDGKGGLTPVPASESGFLAPRKVAGLALINAPAGMAVLVANTGDSVQTFAIRKR